MSKLPHKDSAIEGIASAIAADRAASLVSHIVYRC